LDQNSTKWLRSLRYIGGGGGGGKARSLRYKRRRRRRTRKIYWYSMIL
jgi:hypothetical protein